jgi:predicted SnoaL-like aldol condensation-catalyzing enzyme
MATKQEDNKGLVRRIIETALNGGDLSIADETFRPDYVTHVPGVPPLPQGPGGFKAVISMWRTA